jgi:hypothetical protein
MFNLKTEGSLVNPDGRRVNFSVGRSILIVRLDDGTSHSHPIELWVSPSVAIAALQSYRPLFLQHYGAVGDMLTVAVHDPLLSLNWLSLTPR